MIDPNDPVVVMPPLPVIGATTVRTWFDLFASVLRPDTKLAVPLSEIFPPRPPVGALPVGWVRTTSAPSSRIKLLIVTVAPVLWRNSPPPLCTSSESPANVYGLASGGERNRNVDVRYAFPAVGGWPPAQLNPVLKLDTLRASEPVSTIVAARDGDNANARKATAANREVFIKGRASHRCDVIRTYSCLSFMFEVSRLYTDFEGIQARGFRTKRDKF